MSACRQIGCLLGVILLLGGCGGPSGDGPRRFVLANVHNPGYPTAEALRDLAREAAAEPLLAGRVTIDLQLSGVLGNEKEVLEKLAFGGVQMSVVSAAPLAEFVDLAGVFTLPYLFRDREHLDAVLSGMVGKRFAAALEEAGFVLLAWYDAGSRSFYNRHRPVRSLADLRGLKIRVQKSEIMRQTVEALGASPVAMGFKDVYTNLHTGAIDGAENNLPSYRSERHFEVAKFYSRDRHSVVPDLVLAGRAAWQQLTPEQQDALRRVAQRSAVEQRELWDAYVADTELALASAGCEIADVDDLEAFRQAVAPVTARFGAPFAAEIEEIRRLAAR